jgi:hypothetical protein
LLGSFGVVVAWFEAGDAFFVVRLCVVLLLVDDIALPDVESLLVFCANAASGETPTDKVVSPAINARRSCKGVAFIVISLVCVMG